MPSSTTVETTTAKRRAWMNNGRKWCLMGTKPSDAELGRLAKMYGRGWELIVNGSRTVRDVQTFLEGKPPLPAWNVPTHVQLARAHGLNHERGWGFSPLDFPTSPFVWVRSNAVTLLAVYLPGNGRVDGVQRTIDEHLAVIHQQYLAMGRKVPYLDQIKTDPYHMRLKSNRQDSSLIARPHRPGLRWVTYEYDAYHSPKHGHSVVDLWAGNTSALAASEVLSALMLFPEYGPSMDGNVTPYVNLAGYEVDYPGEKAWSCYPTIGHRLDDGNFVLSVSSATDPGGSEVRASPLFREL